MIISQHIPKAAGTSLLTAFEEVCGERLLRHNANPAVAYSSSKEDIYRKYDVIHGHISYTKAAHLFTDEAFICTFLRDPVERVVSSYHFHMRPDTQNKLAREVQEASMTLTEFATMPPQRNLQARMVNLIGFDRVDLFGLSEFYDESVNRLGEKTGLALSSSLQTNVNPSKKPNSRYDLDPSTRAMITDRNAADIELYEKVASRF